MRQYFNFSRLLNKYRNDIALIFINEGYFNDYGDWIEGEAEIVTLQGAVISYKETKIYRSEGTLTAKDKRFFAFEPLKNALHGSKVYYRGDLYSIADCSDNSEFTGVWAYTLKYVSAFKDARLDIDITDLIDRLEQRLDGVLVASEEIPPENEVTTSANKLDKRLDGV